MAAFEVVNCRVESLPLIFINLHLHLADRRDDHVLGYRLKQHLGGLGGLLFQGLIRLRRSAPTLRSCSGGCFGLSPETCFDVLITEQVGREELEGDGPFEVGVLGLGRVE